MNKLICSLVTVLIMFCFITEGIQGMSARKEGLSWMKESKGKLKSELISRYGEQQQERIERGLEQVAQFWREEDGGADEFEQFVLKNFAGDDKTLDMIFQRFERILEKINGHMNEITLELRKQADLDLGPMVPMDRICSGYNPSAHVKEDFFKNKLAFVVLLNFPLTLLEERLDEGSGWNRRRWAEARLAQSFSKRIPSEVRMEFARAAALADNYIAGYNIWMHHLINEKGERLFPAGMRLLSHWNLRDEIKADYGDGEKGLAKQRMIQKVMERIVTQTIPEVVIDNPHVDWNPFSNEVYPSRVDDSEKPAPENMKVTSSPEPDTRYRILMETFRAARMIDPYSPTTPTHIDRRFQEDREIPEKQVRRILEQVVSSPLVSEVAGIIESRLGRPLEPFDIWYNGFRVKSRYSEAELDRIVPRKYPTADDFEEDIPAFLRKLKFQPEKADWLAGMISVEPARGSGHAWGGEMKGAEARLRTRVGEGGMDYKGFNIAVHEMGHNVEQVISMNDIDHTLLNGVPNTAFTEAFAFIFQENDLMLLGLEGEESAKSDAIRTINDFWMTYEIAGVSLVDMEVWHWMYRHPDATPAQLKRAVLEISRDIWNKYYASVLGGEDEILLGIYSHMIHSFLYLPDYPLGHLIAFQIKKYIEEEGEIGDEVVRMAGLGRIAPDLWMKKATGSRVSAKPLLRAAGKALEVIR